MSYQVTARKWRPQTFAELVGQEHVARTLQNALRHSRIAHAYLFTGTRGVGKTTTARLLAKALNCEMGPTADPCNQCSLCQAITLGSSLDVLEIDGASNRGIDEIRDLREKIRYAPTRGRYKIYIIDEVHMLTEHAFNALLKTLEEPPPGVVFIFATTEPQKVPITILSRCQRFDFRKLASAEIAGCLGKIAEQEGIQISAAALHRVARRAEGSLRDAQTLFDQVIAFCGAQVPDGEVALLLGLAGEEQILHLMQAVVARDPRAVLEALSHLLQRGHDARELCRQLLECVRDMIVVKVGTSVPSVLDRSPAELEGLQKLGAQVAIEELHTLFELLAATEMKVRDSTQPIWMLEVSLVKLASLPHLQSLSTLIARLEALERRLGQIAGGETPPLPSPMNHVRDTEPSLATPATTTTHDMPPPAEPPAAPVVSDQPTSAADITQKIIESASTRPLGWILEQHCKLQLADTALEIIFHGNNRMARELLHEGETLQTLQQIVRTVVGREMAVRIIDTPEPNDEAAPPARSNPPPADTLTSLARAPIVRETLELFGGRILDIRRRSGSREMLERPMGEAEIVSEEEGDDE
jgi:DNA polymerase III subunit gamma/tau